MNYYLDTKFHEYHKQQRVCGIKVGKPIPTIDLISIGIVSEDIEKTLMPPYDTYSETANTHREYYAISKEFDIKAAWNSWQPKKHNLSMGTVKEYWLRENVLKPIFIELFEKENNINEWTVESSKDYHKLISKLFTYKNFKRLINKYGDPNKQIAEEIKKFIYKDEDCTKRIINKNGVTTTDYFGIINKPKFYAYYADYDWVVFSQLFGKMINLPKGFPKYCIDLKQELDAKVDKLEAKDLTILLSDGTFGYTNNNDDNLYFKLKEIKKHKDYPKKDNEYNALGNAKWNKKLHIFIKNL